MKREIEGQYGEPYARLAVLLNEVRGWAKGTLPTYQERKEFFEGIVNGDPDPVQLLRAGDTPEGTGEQAVRELIARAQSAHAPAGVESLSVAALLLEGLARHYGEREALTDVSLSLQRGQTLVVFGPNGAGKSTLLRVLATLLRPHAGSVCVLGLEAARRGMGGARAHRPARPRAAALPRADRAREPALPRAPARRRRGARARSCSRPWR